MEWPEYKFEAFAEGKLYDAWAVLGSHPREDGTAFAV